MNVAIRCLNPFGLKGTNGRAKTAFLSSTFFGPSLFRKVPVAQKRGPHFPRISKEEWFTRCSGARKECLTISGSALLGWRQGQAVSPPLQPSCLLTFLWVFSLGGFTCGLGPSCLCYWEWFPPGGQLSPSPFCRNHVDKPSANKSPVRSIPFL